MADTFKAIVIEKNDDGQTVAMQDLTIADLPAGDVLVKISHSTVNYKDGLAISGAVPIARSFPMVAGIDFAGEVVESNDDRFAKGDLVVMNGFGMSETRWGGYSEYQRVPAEPLIKLPASITPAQAMAIGTAGYTAMLCVLGLEDQGVLPDAGDILVTGASGGVGSVAISLLSKLGYRVVAATGRTSEADYLKNLGAADIIDREELSGKVRPLAKEQWAGVVDAVGSTILANAIATTQYGGTVTACGLAQGADLPASVMPFILRGVKLVGIDSVMAPRAPRVRAWERLAVDLDLAKLETIAQHIGFSEVMETAPKILAGTVRGRLVVDMSR